MSKSTRSALIAAGAAAGAVAATWLGKRRLHAVTNENAERHDPESVELPIGHSADPEIEDALTGDVDSRAAPTDEALDEIWNSLPGFAEGEQTEGYDAVTPEDLGTVWLERATQTTHEHLPHASDPSDTPALESLAISEASIASSHALDDDAKDEADEDEYDDDDEALDMDDDVEK